MTHRIEIERKDLIKFILFTALLVVAVLVYRDIAREEEANYAYKEGVHDRLTEIEVFDKDTNTYLYVDTHTKCYYLVSFGADEVKSISPYIVRGEAYCMKDDLEG